MTRIVPIYPKDLNELQRQAKMLLYSGVFKPSWQTRDNAEAALAECCVVIQRGMDVGLSPTQSIEGIAIINGKTLIYGDTLTAVLWAAGCVIEKWTEGEGDKMVGHAKITRPDGLVIQKSYSHAEAEQANLVDYRETVTDKRGKTKPNDAPWFRFRPRMLEWRAFGFAVKDGASDFSKGIAMMEEMAPFANDPVEATNEINETIDRPTQIPAIPEG